MPTVLVIRCTESASLRRVWETRSDERKKKTDKEKENDALQNQARKISRA